MKQGYVPGIDMEWVILEEKTGFWFVLHEVPCNTFSEERIYITNLYVFDSLTNLTIWTCTSYEYGMKYPQLLIELLFIYKTYIDKHWKRTT